jgi:cyanate permease
MSRLSSRSYKGDDTFINSANAEEAGRLTAMTFYVGYLLSALGPVAVGGLRDATGSYSAPFLALAALSMGMLVASFWFGPRLNPQS